MNDIIFRCSSLPALSGAKGLGVTGQKEAIKTYIAQKLDRTKEVKSKYLEKGVMMESGAIEMVNRVLNTSYQKNEVRMVNEFITGECDVEEEIEICDIKCSWDLFTFHDAIAGDGKSYEWQLRGYMELWKKPKASTIHCLMDMPDNLLLAELEKAGRSWNDDLPDFVAIRIIKNYLYDKDNFYSFLEKYPVNRKKVAHEINKFVHIPEKDRIYQLKYERDMVVTAKIYGRINEARQFLKTIYEIS